MAEGESTGKVTDEVEARRALNRYLFYCNRYQNHQNSLKFENKLYQKVKVNLVT